MTRINFFNCEIQFHLFPLFSLLRSIRPAFSSLLLPSISAGRSFCAHSLVHLFVCVAFCFCLVVPFSLNIPCSSSSRIWSKPTRVC
jgi:hypothetical protein